MAHHKVKNGELAEVGKVQYLLHSLYARCEPLILRLFCRLPSPSIGPNCEKDDED